MVSRQSRDGAPSPGRRGAPSSAATRFKESLMSATEAVRAANEDAFFSATLAQADPEIADVIAKELGRQRDEIELIASENIVSRAVLEAQGSVLTNKYAEGYPGRRYYGGCQFVDVAETLAIERAKKLFGAGFANVQPNSGSQMNQAVFLALAEARRHLHGARSRGRRAPDPRLAGQRLGQVVQGGALHGAARGPDHRHGRGRAHRARERSRRSSSRAAAPIRASGTSPASARSPTRSGRS